MPNDPELNPKASPEPPPPIEPKPDPAAESAANDQPPKKKGPGRPKGGKNKPKDTTKAREPREPKPATEPAEIRAIRKQLESLLRSPAFAFEAVGETWPAQHVDRQGAVLAMAVAQLAHRNPIFKARLQAFLEGGENTKLIIAGVMYAAPLAIYFGVLPAPARVRELMQIPERTAGIVAPTEVPPEVKIQAEREAVEQGFVNEAGEADLDAYLDSVRARMAAGQI